MTSTTVNSETPIEIKGLSKAFDDKVVLAGVDLVIPPGSVVGLVGTNGAGKSTLIKCLLGLFNASGGSSLIFGEESGSISADVKARLGYVPQEIRLYPWMRVKQIIDYTGVFYETWDEEWVASLVKRWNLNPEDRIGPLSAGQAQKLALVLALGHHPELLVLDEPVASLDPVGRREFLRSLLETGSEKEQTVLFSTHITSDLERIASHVAILKEGRIDFFGELDELKERFKRLRIRAAEDLPKDFSVPGAVRVEVEGNTALVSIPEVSDELIAQLKADYSADVKVEDLNLEEIFVELHDGE